MFYLRSTNLVMNSYDDSIANLWQLEPVGAFKCVSAAEAEEIGKRLYAGHRKKDASDQKGSKGDNGQGRTTANKNGNQSVVSVAMVTLYTLNHSSAY